MTAPRTIGGHEVVRQLGRGGMGVVFEALEPTLGRRVALKLITGGPRDPLVVARFRREVELLARVRHEGVVEVHAVGDAPEGPYVVMALVDGEPLADVAARGVAPREAARIVRELCAAVSAVHAQGVLHRDLKAQNVILRPDGRPVLLDFGVARALDSRTLTATGAAIGSPRTMSPEQAAGDAALDERTDVYGLGAILFELLGGEPPFAEVAGAYATMAAVLHKEPRWPSSRRPVPAGLEAICRQAMAKDPSARPPSARALRDALTAWLTAPEPARAPRAVVAAAGVLALAVIAGVALARWTRPTAPPRTDTTAPTDATAVIPSAADAPPTRPAPAGALRPAWTLRHEGEADRLCVAWVGTRLVTTNGASGRTWTFDAEGARHEAFTAPAPVLALSSAGDELMVVWRGGCATGPPAAVTLPGAPDGPLVLTAGALSPDGRLTLLGVGAPPALRGVMQAPRPAVDGAERVIRMPDLVRWLGVSPDGARAAALLDGAITGETIVQVLGLREADGGGLEPGRYTALAWHPDARSLWIGDQVGAVWRFDVDQERLSAPFAPPASGAIVGLAATARALLAASRDPRNDASALYAWDVGSGRRTTLVEDEFDYTGLALDPTGAWLAVPAGPRVEVWPVERLLERARR